MSDWSAIYMPALSGSEDPSRSGFATKEEAEEYVFSKMCSSCKGQRQLFLDGAPEPENFDNYDYEFPSAWPGCACEWTVEPTEKTG